jgi:hypothetical protein
MPRGRFRRFHPISSLVAPPERQGRRAAYDRSPTGAWTFEVDLRDTAGGLRSGVTACPGCAGGMAVEEIDLVSLVARLVCGGCGILRARLLPAASTS